MKSALFYSLKVLFVTALLGPAIHLAILQFTDPAHYGSTNLADGLLYAFPLGLIVLIPSFILVFFAVRILSRTKTPLAIKWMLTWFSPLFILMTIAITDLYSLMHVSYWLSVVPAFTAYLAAFILGVWIYKLNVPVTIEAE